MLMFESNLMDAKKDQILRNHDHWTDCTEDYQTIVWGAIEYINENNLDIVDTSEWPASVDWIEGEDWVQTTVKRDALYKPSLYGLAQSVLYRGKANTLFAIDEMRVLKHKNRRRFFVLIKFRHEKLKKKRTIN